MRFIDPDGMGPFDGVIKGGINLVKHIVTEAIYAEARYIGEQTRDFLSKVKVTPYFEGSANLSAGGQSADKVKAAGFDANLGSAELLGVSVSAQKGSVNGEINYIGKNGETDISNGVSVGVEPVDVGYNHTYSINNKDQYKTSEETQGSLGVGIPGVVLETKVGKSSDLTKKTDEYSMKLGFSSNFSLGHAFIFRASASVGIKASIKTEEK